MRFNVARTIHETLTMRERIYLKTPKLAIKKSIRYFEVYEEIFKSWGIKNK
jgi:hypothetical protein